MASECLTVGSGEAIRKCVGNSMTGEAHMLLPGASVLHCGATISHLRCPCTKEGWAGKVRGRSCALCNRQLLLGRAS